MTKTLGLELEEHAGREKGNAPLPRRVSMGGSSSGCVVYAAAQYPVWR